ncbi:RNA helicase [Mucilaginibacter pedocola]|uniref:RNA helicase n=2 Tax=Mucilaginibacter pedocola TaxID=1792845 RepID=A0A1S9PJ30_9SPHI|nr:RNA helicase [Mucilaginibacter pedocola]
MVWAEKFKLNKQLIKTVTELGFGAPKDIQLKTLTRITGGQDVIGIGPEGAGKTTTLVLGTLNRFNYKADGVPRALVLAPDQERVFEIVAQLERINRNTSIRIVSLHNGSPIDQQMDDLADGADIVVATPDRARAIYLKLGLNLNKVTYLAIDDAHLIVKQGLQLPVVELATSIDKGQHIVFTEVMHDRLEKMIGSFMVNPATIEVDDLPEEKLATYPQMLYHVPNFGTKLNLLSLFMQDDEVFTKTVVFVNTKTTAETLYKSLTNRLRKSVALLAPAFFEYNQVKDVEAFTNNNALRVLIVAQESIEAGINVQGIPFILHFDIPAEKEDYIAHITDSGVADEETLALTFATDIELDQVRKIEQITGQKMQLAELPEDLVIEKTRAQKEADKPEKPKRVDPNKYVPGEAFHEKKPENAKTYNFSANKKAKMNKKKNH